MLRFSLTDGVTTVSAEEAVDALLETGFGIAVRIAVALSSSAQAPLTATAIASDTNSNSVGVRRQRSGTMTCRLRAALVRRGEETWEQEAGAGI